MLFLEQYPNLKILFITAGNKLHVASVDGNVELEDHFRCNYLNDRHLDTFLSQMYTVDKSISLDAKFFDKIVGKYKSQILSLVSSPKILGNDYKSSDRSSFFQSMVI